MPRTTERTEQVWVGETLDRIRIAIQEGRMPPNALFRIRNPPQPLQPGEAVELPKPVQAAPQALPDLQPPTYQTPVPQPMPYNYPQPYAVPNAQEPLLRPAQVIPVRGDGFFQRLFGRKAPERFKRLAMQGMKCYRCQMPNSEWGDQLEGRTICSECKRQIEKTVA